MSTAIEKREKAVAPATMYEVFAQMARDPSIDLVRIKGLMDLQFVAEARQAEREFNAAFARLQGKLPRIVKQGKVTLIKDGVNKGSIPFAKWEDIDQITRPLLNAEGFSLSFTSAESTKGVSITAVLLHAEGHEKRSTMELPPDAGPGRNSLQAIGSARSYAKRYLACDLLNIITVNEDNDAASVGCVDERQAGLLSRAIQTVGANQEKLLAIYGVKGVSEIPKVMYRAVQGQIEEKCRKSLQNAGADDAEIREKITALWQS